MKREIKFRAWATNANKMIDLKGITPMALSAGMLDEGDGLFIPFRDDIILMQFIGLKDKNGVNIFEGDILQYLEINIPYTIKPYYENYTVEYINGGFRFISKDQSIYGFASDDQIDYEIIGNIHQNPELL